MTYSINNFFQMCIHNFRASLLMDVVILVFIKAEGFKEEYAQTRARDTKHLPAVIYTRVVFNIVMSI